MKNTRSILLITIMLFTVLTAGLLLLTIFDVTGAEETRQTIIKLAEASAVIVGTCLVIFGISSLNQK